jgi:hypothetical protein
MESYGLGEVFAREQSLKRAKLGGFSDATTFRQAS